MVCSVVTTSAGYKPKGKSLPGVPLIVCGRQFLEPACAYLRWLVTKGNCEASSARTYAFHLAPFFSFVEARMSEEDKTFGEVSNLREAILQVRDEHLEVYLNCLEEKDQLHGTLAARRDSIFAFYAWMELEGIVYQHVRLPGMTERFTPKLSSLPARSVKGRRGSKFGVVSTIKVGGKRSKPRPTPTAEQVSLLYPQAVKCKSEDLQDRNVLLLDWYHEMGVRRIEWTHLLVSEVPTAEELDLLPPGEPVDFTLMVTKGSRIGVMQTMPELLESTREYIDGPRRRLVERFQARDPDYKEPAEIFLSNKTGLPLTNTTVSNLVGSWFKAAGVPGSGHRLRARHLQGVTDAELDAEEAAIASSGGTKVFIDERGVIMRVTERSRHVDEESLKAYVKRNVKGRYKRTDRITMVTLEMQIQARTQKLAALDAMVAQREAALEALGKGSFAEGRLASRRKSDSTQGRVARNPYHPRQPNRK